jgi:hypothetical protein
VAPGVPPLRGNHHTGEDDGMPHQERVVCEECSLQAVPQVVWAQVDEAYVCRSGPMCAALRASELDHRGVLM